MALIRRVQPANPWATSNNLSALVVFLKAMRGSDAAHVGLLTGDAILQFRTLRHLHRPQADATTQQMVNRLQRLLATKKGETQSTRTRARVRPSDPCSDAKMAILHALAAKAPARDARTLSIVMPLVEQHGCPRAWAMRARVEDSVLIMGRHSIVLDDDAYFGHTRTVAASACRPSIWIEPETSRPRPG